MRILLAIAAMAVTGWALSCKKQFPSGSEALVNISLNNCANNIFADKNKRLCFDSVLSDSRCPANAQCVWQGTAIAKFSFYINGNIYNAVLSTLPQPGSYDNSIILSGYKIEFIDLHPYPGLTTPQAGNNITADVKITRL